MKIMSIFFLQRVAYWFLVFTRSEQGKQWWRDDGGGGGGKRLGMEEMEELPWLLFLKVWCGFIEIKLLQDVSNDINISYTV